jgi:hypothetical protein
MSFSLQHESVRCRPCAAVSVWSSLKRRTAKLALALLLSCSFGLLGTVHSRADLACKPILSFKNVREIRPAEVPIAPWTWKATVVVNAKHCATRTGSFEIDFVQSKEYAPDLQFTEKFQWVAGQIDVSLDLDASEAIVDYRLGFIAPCMCRELPSDLEPFFFGR